MHRKSIVALGLCALMALVVSARADTMIADFEDGGVGGFQAWSGNPVSNVTVGGTKAMQMVVTNQYWGQETTVDWANAAVNAANLNPADTIEFDLMLPSAGYIWPTAPTAQIKLWGPSEADQYAPAAAIPTSLLLDVWQHVVIPVPDRATALGGIDIYLNPGYGSGGAYSQQVMYVDNLKFVSVPEPASLALLALGGLMGLRRRA
jgi:hypothetical protein